MKHRPLKIDVDETDRALIARAAAATGKSQPEFMRDAAINAAADTLLDRTVLHVDAKTYARFLAALDGAPQGNERLRELLLTRPPWE